MPDPDTALRIAHVYCRGNHVTKEDIIRTVTGIDTGMVFDTLKIRKAKQALASTGLFLKADIIRLVKGDSVDIYIMVKEMPYFGISTLDFTPYHYRYGERGTWFCPLFGVEFSNLRGRMETLRMYARLWEWRTLSLRWSKPFLPTPFILGLSAFADARPDNAFAMDRHEFAGSVTAGMRLFERSWIFLSAMPDFQRSIVRTDTSQDISDFYQAFGAARLITDRRYPRYDPMRGWLFQFETLTNGMYHDAASPLYVQFAADVRFYHRGFLESHKTAYHASITARTNDAGIQNRLVLGGLGSVRGYANSGIDLQRTASSSLLFSLEYRFPIFQLPSISPLLPRSFRTIMGRFIGDLSDIAPRIDGGLIFDYGRVAADFDHLFSKNGSSYRSGTDFGFGFRLMEPGIRRSACMDIVWIENPITPENDFYAVPSWQIYLDLCF